MRKSIDIENKRKAVQNKNIFIAYFLSLIHIYKLFYNTVTGLPEKLSLVFPFSTSDPSEFQNFRFLKNIRYKRVSKMNLIFFLNLQRKNIDSQYS